MYTATYINIAYFLKPLSLCLYIIENEIEVLLQPIDTTVAVSKDLLLAVEASCVDPLTYTWQKSSAEVKGEEWEEVSLEWEQVSSSNTTDAQLIITGVTISDTGLYRCLIRSKSGSSIISQPAAVTVISTGECFSYMWNELVCIYNAYLCTPFQIGLSQSFWRSAKQQKTLMGWLPPL